MDTQHDDPCPLCTELDEALGELEDRPDLDDFAAITAIIAEHITPEIKKHKLAQIIGGSACPRQDSNLRPSDP